MEKSIHGIYGPEILEEAMNRFRVEPGNITELGGFESYVYEFVRGGRGYILRITHSSHRTDDQINGELEWINYLAANGVAVSGAITSGRGNYVEVIPAGDTYFSAVVFNKARGHRPAREDFGEDLYVNWGRLIGRMHALTKDFSPSRKEYRRSEWDQDGYLDFERHLPPSQTLVRESGKRIIDTVRTLPRGRDSYGLIHTDAHAGNFFVEDGKISIFDFDDCAYNWFASDIAITLFYSTVNMRDEAKKLEFTEMFMEKFLEGYHGENYLEPYWFSKIPLFLKLREFCLYVAIQASLDSRNPNPWCASYIEHRRELIENEVPFVNFDFEKAAGRK